MANINLLPWRQELRQERQRQFISVLGLVAVLGIVVVGAIWQFQNAKIQRQQERNKFLTNEIGKLESQTKEIKSLEDEKERLIARMNRIDSLQKSRPQVVKVFDGMVSAVPEGLNLIKMTRRDRMVGFEGLGESLQRVSSFIRGLDETELFTESPSLKNTKEVVDRDGVLRQSFVIEATEVALEGVDMDDDTAVKGSN